MKIPLDIYNLDCDELGDNLLHYDYNVRKLSKLTLENHDKEDLQYQNAHSCFKGELYENVVYELLLRYALTNDDITKFILKGPHQKLSNVENEKNGLLIDSKKQIVYKAGYKDISELDGLFFTEDSVVFVESTIVQSTLSLRKRLRKKKSLLELLFPHLKVKSLIIVCEGALGLSKFPPYCYVWVTKQLNTDFILDKIINRSKTINDFETLKHSKLTHAKDVTVMSFKYFNTLGWILHKSRELKTSVLNFEFLKSKKIDTLFNIYSKIYIGFVKKDVFLNEILNGKLEGNVQLDYFYVAILKLDNNSYVLNYFTKIDKVIKKITLEHNKILVESKDRKGFTTAEIKYVSHVIKDDYAFSANEINEIKDTIKTW